jgi:predicted ATPase
VWDPQIGKHVHTIAEHPGIVYAVAWGSSADVVISGSSDGALRWWNVQRGECVWLCHAHQGTVQSLRRSPDGTMLASCGDDGAIMLWDLRTSAYLQTIRRQRPYEGLNITGINGLTEAEKASLIALGAVDRTSGGRAVTSDDPQSLVSTASGPQAIGDRNIAVGLPFQPSPLIGRDVEISEIVRLLSDPACRLVTLIGPGGIGKTRLALAVATSQTATFADGVVFVALASVGTPNHIVSAIGDTLDLSCADQADPAAHLFDYLRTRHMLLVLDDFDHLLDGADLVTAILAHAPHVTILITSRIRLNLQAEWLFDVQGLAYPLEDPHGLAATLSLADLNQYSAVRLFVQRATQIQPGLSLTESTLITIVRICQHVGGMPLAIELATASVRTLPIAMIERQIHANLDMLSTTFRDVSARHRSMRAVFERSWSLLSERERMHFSRLAVFRGGWTADAAAHIANATLPALAALVDKSLVLPGSVRYAMLEPIREYALERLAERGETMALQRAHAEYYLALAEAVAAHWHNPATDAAIKQLDHEFDNLRAALQWARDGGDRTLGLRLAGALRRFWRSRGAIGEGRSWLEELLALDDDTLDASAMAARLHALEAAAWLASDQHDYTHAARRFEQSMDLRRAMGETENETNLLVNAALEARAVGQYRRATALLEDALARQHALGDRGSLSSAGLGLSLFLMGLVIREQGDFARAMALFAECTQLHREIGDREGIALGLLGLCDIARDHGDVAQVRMYGEESLATLRKLGVQWAIGFALNNLALAAYQEGDMSRAFALVSESVALFRAQKADASLAEVLITLGQIVAAQGDVVAAYGALTEALRLAWAVGPRLLVASALEGLASLAAQAQQADLAIRFLGAASALRAQMGTPIRPADQSAVEHALATARATLGTNVAASIWSKAIGLPLEQILSSIPSAATFDAPRD